MTYKHMFYNSVIQLEKFFSILKWPILTLYSVFSIIWANGGGGDAQIIEKYGQSELYILYTNCSFG
jgi:hypothetical protein